MSAAKRKQLGDRLVVCAELYITARDDVDRVDQEEDLGDDKDTNAEHDALGDAFRALKMAIHEWRKYGEHEKRDPLGR